VNENLFAPAALVEHDDLALYYEAEKPGLGLRFVDAVEEAIDAILEFPESAPVTPFDERLRQKLVTGFPCMIIYSIRDTGIRIEAVAHTSREPGYWQDR
jgi:toxin ParE1/3/4